MLRPQMRSSRVVAVLAARPRRSPLGPRRRPLAGIDPAPAHRARPRAPLRRRRFATGFNRPTWVGGAPGDPTRCGCSSSRAASSALEGGRRTTVLDLTGRVKLGAEQGLLGIAFHPDFATNRRLYLHWRTRRRHARGRVPRAPRREIDPAVRELLHVDQPEENHNGGQLAFGPDGRLYLGLGDGGGAFDPTRTRAGPATSGSASCSRSTSTRRAATGDVVLTGLRNPWRFSFDPALGEVWIGDVGQDDGRGDRPRAARARRAAQEPRLERVRGHRARRGPRPGPRAASSSGRSRSTRTTDGCSVTGGFVYRGAGAAGARRRYVYGDFCSGALWTLEGTPEGRAADVRREQGQGARS